MYKNQVKGEKLKEQWQEINMKLCILYPPPQKKTSKSTDCFSRETSLFNLWGQFTCIGIRSAEEGLKVLSSKMDTAEIRLIW